MLAEGQHAHRAASNKALNRLWANGTIKNLQRIWLAKATGAPVLK